MQRELVGRLLQVEMPAEAWTRILESEIPVPLTCCVLVLAAVLAAEPRQATLATASLLATRQERTFHFPGVDVCPLSLSRYRPFRLSAQASHSSISPLRQVARSSKGAASAV